MVSGCDVWVIFEIEGHCGRIVVVFNTGSAFYLDVLALPDGVDHAHFEKPFHDLMVVEYILSVLDRPFLRILAHLNHFCQILPDI